MKRILAGMLALALVLGSFAGWPQTLSAAAGLDEYVQLTDGSYRPFEQGYYGYFPVCYEGGAGTETCALAALVRDGHTYLSPEDVCGKIDMTCTTDAQAGLCSVSAWQRTVTFQKDSAVCEVQIGPFRLEASMPLAAVYQDETVWVPAEWFFWMTGGTFFPLPDGYVAIGAQETALDVVAELYEDDGAFDYTTAFGLTEESLREIDDALKRFDVYDGLLNGEIDKWTATSRYPQSAFITESAMYDLITDSKYGSDFMKLMLEINADEAYSIAEAGEKAAKFVFDQYFDYVGNFYGAYSQNAENMATVANMLADDAASAGNYRFAQVLGRYSNKKVCESMDAARIKGVSDALLKTADALFVVLDIYKAAKSYEKRDEAAQSGARATMEVLERSEKLGLTGLPHGVINAMESTLNLYEKGEASFTFGKWFWDNVGGYTLDAVSKLFSVASLPVELYQIGSRFLPSYMTGLEEAESFEMSLEGILYQPAAYTAFINAADDYFEKKRAFFPIRGAAQNAEVTLDEDAFEPLMKQAYYYMKVLCVTRNLALTALQSHESSEAYQAQAALWERDMERLGLLCDYCEADLPLPAQWEEKAEGYSDSYLQALVTPAYLHMTGRFVDAQAKEAIADVNVKASNSAKRVCAEFISGEDGSFDLYVPLEWKSGAATVQPLQTPAAEFVPWEIPWSRSFAYSDLTGEAPIVFECVYREDSQQKKTFRNLQMVQVEAVGTTWELRLDAGDIFLGLDYYQFIHDELLPEAGMASLETAQQEVGTDFSALGWDRRTGLLGADIIDMNVDGIEDLLVYSAEDSAGYATPSGGCAKTLRASLYSISEEGEIVLITARDLLEYNDLTYNRIKVGLMEKDDTPYLYVEEDSYAYFANGGSVTYTWYCWDEKGALRPRWMVGHTDGGSIELASSLLDYYELEAYDKYVLCADGGFRYFYPEVEVLTDESYAYETDGALRAGFAMLGLEEVGVYRGSPNLYFTQAGQLPTCWGTSVMKESCGYQCTGQRQGAGGALWQMTTGMEDRTGLREKMAEIDAAGE